MSTAPIVNAVDQEDIQYARTPWWIVALKRKFILKSRTPMPQNSEGEGANQSEPERGFWANEAEFILSLLGLSVGLGNVWRFPWMVWRNGGGAFLIPYTLMLILCGLPLFLMELTIGQYSGCGPGNVFQIAPIFKGLGWCVLCNAVIFSAYYITIIAWSFYYMFSSFQKSLPWIGCNKYWNTDNCFSLEEHEVCVKNSSLYMHRRCMSNTTENFRLYQLLNDTDRVPAPQEYFNRKMYSLYYADSGIQRPMEDVGPPKWDLLLTLMFSWLVTYVCICKGIKSSGKAVYFTAIFPYIAITGLLIVASQLDGAGDGVEFYLTPNITRLSDHRVWVDAASQIFYSLGLSGGSVMTYASYSKYNNNILRDCLIVGIGNSVTSLFAGFPIFCVLGHMAKALNRPIESVTKSGSALVFVAYPEVVNKLPGASFWSAVFFLMLITLGLDSQFGTIETLLTAVLDKMPRLIPKKPLVAAGICACVFILGLSTVTFAGVYWEELLNYYSGWSTIILASINCFVYSWVYGAGKLIDHLQHMTNIKFPVTVVWILLALWKVVSVLVILVIVVFNMINVYRIDYHGYVLPDWAQAFGWLTALVPLLLVPVAAAYTYLMDRRSDPYGTETFLQRISRLLKPTDKWLPSYLKTDQRVSQISASLKMSASASHTTDYGSKDDVDNGGRVTVPVLDVGPV